MKTLYLVAAVMILACASFAQQPVNLLNVGGTAVSTGNGVSGAGSMRVNISSDNTAFQVKLLGNGGGVMDVAQGGGTAAASALQIAGVFNTSLPTLTTGQAGAIQLDSSGRIFVNCATGCSASSTISLVPATTGGLTLAHTVSAGSTNATSLKATAGQAYQVCVNGNSAYPVYLKLYNKASAPTVGTDTPVKVLESQAGVPICMQTEEGWTFATGIAWALTKGIADADTTAVLANDATVEIAYK